MHTFISHIKHNLQEVTSHLISTLDKVYRQLTEFVLPDHTGDLLRYCTLAKPFIEILGHLLPYTRKVETHTPTRFHLQPWTSIVCMIFHSKSEDTHTATFCHSNVDLPDSNEGLSRRGGAINSVVQKCCK